MEKKGRFGPFRPGAGVLPPYLSGRESEQALFRDLLADMAQGIAPAGEVVLHGPRGNGKTALLTWIERALGRCAELDVVLLSASAFRTPEELWGRLLPESRFPDLSPDEITIPGMSSRPGEEPTPALEKLLAARAKQKPLVVLLDEAHTLDIELGRLLLSASQSVRGQELPFLLVLAGTPGLREHLHTMGVSFWNRARSLPIGRLADKAVAEAIRKPLAAESIEISKDALARILDETDGYPYFLQLWGEAIWTLVSGASGDYRRFTRAEVSAARRKVEPGKQTYYRDRYDELHRIRQLPVARAVAEAFRGAEFLNDSELEAALILGLGGKPSDAALLEAEAALPRLGYIWRPGTSVKWEPGIPGLMAYIRKHTPPPQRKSPFLKIGRHAVALLGNAMKRLRKIRNKVARALPTNARVNSASTTATAPVEIAEDTRRLTEWDMSEVPKGATLHTTLLFPDGATAQVSGHGALLVETTRWLWRNGRLTRDNIPFRSGPIRYIINTEPFHSNGGNFDEPKKVAGTPLFVESFTAGRKDAIRYTIKLLNRGGIDPASVRIRPRASVLRMKVTRS